MKKINETINKANEEMYEREQERMDKIQQEVKELYDGYDGYEDPIRGLTTTGASFGDRLRCLWKLATPFDELEIRFGELEIYKNNMPGSNVIDSLLKKGGDLYNYSKDKSKDLGKWIYEREIPVVSDYYGALLNGRKEDAEINAISMTGKFARGLCKGAISIVEVAGNFVIHPIEMSRGLSTALSNIDKTALEIGKEVKNVWDNTVVNGNGEDRAELAGQIAFGIVSYLIGAGEVKTATTAAGKVGKEIIEETVEKLEKKLKKVLRLIYQICQNLKKIKQKLKFQKLILVLKIHLLMKRVKNLIIYLIIKI